MEFTVKIDQSEDVQYDIVDFPAYVRKGYLSSYPDYRAISHWHDDIELILILSGQMNYNINGNVILLNTGEGLFVNGRQFHYGYSNEHLECKFICILLHPILLCSSPYVERNYITPVLQNEALPYRILHKDTKHEKDILKTIQKIYDLRSSEMCAFHIQRLFFEIWESLLLLSDSTKQITMPRNQHLTLLKDMIHYIHKNYASKITLSDISAAGKVGKTTCTSIFQKYTNETPISYLTNFRLKKSLELLLSTDKTISEICYQVGFSGASYYTETFHKAYGYTPKRYRSLNSKSDILQSTFGKSFY